MDKENTKDPERIIPFPDISPDETGLNDLIQEQQYDIVRTLTLRLQSAQFEQKDTAKALKSGMAVVADLCDGVLDLDETVSRLRMLVDEPEKARKESWYIG